jgi:hypothetical protein
MQDTNERLDALEALVEAQRTEIARLRAKVDGTAGDAPSDPEISRRAVFHGLAAAAVGAAAGAAATGRAEAANGDPLILGQYRTATYRTSIVYQGGTAGEYGLGVTDGNLDRFPVSAGVAGHAEGMFCGVLGYSRSGRSGVYGLSPNGIGVRGESGSETGVYGMSYRSTGVLGSSTTGAGVVGGGRIGVFGEGAPSAGAVAVGVWARAYGAATALNVEGPFRYTRAGVARVPAGQRTIAVNVPGLTAKSLVLATVQATSAVPAAVACAGTVRTTTTSQILLRLTANAPSTGLLVAWFVVDRP